MKPFPNPQTSHGRSRHVIAVVVEPDTAALEVMVAQEIFGPRMESLVEQAGDDANPYEVVLCGERARVTLPSGADLGPLQPLSLLAVADTIIVPGVENPLAERSGALIGALGEGYAAGARIVSFCAGAFILGQAGILDGRRATTHWRFAEEFRQQFPRARLEPQHLYVDDRNVHTSAGVLSATDLSLHLLSLDLGHAYARDYSRTLVSAPRRHGRQPQGFAESIRPNLDGGVQPLQQWLGDHIHEPLSLAMVAEHLHLSQRSVMRKFRDEVGLPLFDWILRERVERAKELLESTDTTISDISAMVGFGSSESLRRNFEKLVGTSPRSYRASFRARRREPGLPPAPAVATLG